MRGQKHLIKCRCVLPQFKNNENPPAHQFTVFSIIDDEDKVSLKYSQCNNCGIIHKIKDICVSEIQNGKEAMSSIITIDDIKTSLPSNLSEILERNNVDISSWEMAQFILENKKWGEIVVLSHENDGGQKYGKYVRIMGETFFKVENFTRNEVVVPQEEI